MFEEKKEKYTKNSSSFSYNQSSSQNNNLFNLIQNNTQNNKIDENNFNEYSNNSSKSAKKYDYNQDFLKRQNNNLFNNDDEEDNNTNFTNNNSSDNNFQSNSRGIFGNYGIKSNNENDNNDFRNNNFSTSDTNKYGLSVNISNYETRMSGMEETVFFLINLYSKLSGKSWTVSHKFMDFFELNLIFDKYYVNAPYFPNGTLVGTEGVTDVNHRKTILNQYIKEVCNRSDLMTSIYCIKFLKLENHYPSLMNY